MNESPLIKLKGTEKKNVDRFAIRQNAFAASSPGSTAGHSLPNSGTQAGSYTIFSISSSLSGRLDRRQDRKGRPM